MKSDVFDEKIAQLQAKAIELGLGLEITCRNVRLKQENKPVPDLTSEATEWFLLAVVTAPATLNC